MKMPKNTEVIITKDNFRWEPTGITGKYVGLCFNGLGVGAILGCYIGGVIGFTGALI